jgi:DNA-binding NarL/FixJ family response regulator
MKPDHKFALIVDGKTTFHYTIEECLLEADNAINQDAKSAHIFAHQMSAQRAGWTWDATGKTKKKPVKKAGEERAAKTWTDTELDVLKEAYNDGMTVPDIADALHRTPSSVSNKIGKLHLKRKSKKK